MIENSFDKLVSNWNNLPTDKIDDSFYFDKGDMFLDKTDATSKKEWFRILLYQVHPGEVQRFRDKLLEESGTAKGILLFRMGVSYHESTPYFTPFIQVAKKRSDEIIKEDSFSLIPKDHLPLAQAQSTVAVGARAASFRMSDPVPLRFVNELQYNWLVSSPAQMADHFKVIESRSVELQNKPVNIPSLEFVRFYSYNTVINLKKVFGDAYLDKIADIRQVEMSMGLNHNKLFTELTTFAPILMYRFNTESNSDQGYFEEIANPCPPTCGHDD